MLGLGCVCVLKNQRETPRNALRAENTEAEGHALLITPLEAPTGVSPTPSDGFSVAF